MNRRDKGFTLIEMLVSVTIGVILVGMAAPGFQQLILRNRVGANANELLYAFGRARAEALKLSSNTVVCHTDSPDVATPQCSGTDWKKGWLAFEDCNVNNQYDGASNVCSCYSATTNVTTANCRAETLLLVHGGLSKSDDASDVYQITSDTNVASRVVFRSQGVVQGTIGKLVLKNSKLPTGEERTICIAITGRARVVKGSTCT